MKESHNDEEMLISELNGGFVRPETKKKPRE